MEKPGEHVVEFASKLFGLARQGATEQLAAYVEAGVNPNLAKRADLLALLRTESPARPLRSTSRPPERATAAPR